MDWIDSFDFFLFDLDGLLVNTEPIHLKAYLELCGQWGLNLDWDWLYYSKLVHADSSNQRLREAIYQECSGLYEREPVWAKLHAKKREIYDELLTKEDLRLLPGVADLLVALETAQKKRCVVTNSNEIQTKILKERIPLLNTIPTWFPRESYENPKPSPDGYLEALKWGEGLTRQIGFEDTLRGVRAMEEAGIPTKFLIKASTTLPPHFKLREGLYHCPSFLEVPQALKGSS